MVLDAEARAQVNELNLILHQIHRATWRSRRYDAVNALADTGLHIINHKLLEGDTYYGHRETTEQSKDSTDS
jgi:hypothetical protein